MDAMELDEKLIVVEALYTVMMESVEAEIVRIALSGLVNTEAGRQYLETHPIRL